MRTCIALFILIPAALRAEDKLSVDDRVEILRGLSSEYATLKAYLPRSKKPRAHRRPHSDHKSHP